MVHRSHGRGTLQIDRRFGKVLGPGARARIQVASGTNDLKTFRVLNVMLDEFAERQPGLLEEIRDHHLTPLQAYRLWHSGEWLRYTENTRHAADLIETAEAWAKKRRGLSERTQGARLLWLKLLRRRARAGATLADLPAIMERYRADCEDEDTASTFNHARAHARAFLRDTVKKSDRLYRAVVDVAALHETPKVARHPQTPEGARAIADKLGPKAGAIWLTLCCTGMGPKEFWEDGWVIEYELEAIRILGKKTPRRRRLVPLVMLPVVPQLTRDGFKSALRRCGADVAPYDARRTYAVWMSAAGIPQNRRDYYRGHAPVAMGELYEQPDDTIRGFLRADAAALRAYAGFDHARLAVTP